MLLNPTPPLAQASSPEAPGEQSWHVVPGGPGRAHLSASSISASSVGPSSASSTGSGLKERLRGTCRVSGRRGGAIMQQLRAQALKLDKPGFKSRLRLRVHQLCVLGKFSTGQRLILFFCGAVMVTTAPPLGGPGRAGKSIETRCDTVHLACGRGAQWLLTALTVVEVVQP